MESFDRQRWEAALFDLDGILTRTSDLHAEAWKATFDELQQQWARTHGHPFAPFEIEPDYAAYVANKPRLEGVTAFLESRRIVLPFGHEDDELADESVQGIANHKRDVTRRHIADVGASAYASSLRFVEWIREEDVAVGVVTSSRSARAVLEAAGIEDLVDELVDGVVADQLGLPSVPDPARYLEASRRLGVDPADVAVVDDGVSGIEAARLGRFGLVIAIDRTGDAEALEAAEPDVMVTDLAELIA